MDFTNIFKRAPEENKDKDSNENNIDDSKYTAVFSSVLAFNKSIYRLIDDIYELEKYHYYKLAKESDWYNNVCITQNR